MLKILFTTVIVAFPFICFSQDFVDEAYFDTEGLMLDRFGILTSDNSDGAKDSACAEISSLLAKFLLDPNSFDEEFELKNLGKKTSADQLLNIYTWNYQNSKFEYKYGGVVQYRTEVGAKPIVFELKQNAAKIPHDRTDHTNWYGCLYYQIIQNSYKGISTYTVFGWDGNNSMVSRKVIDVITVNRNGAYFGKPIFYMEKGRMNRMVFQYNSQTVMMLAYEDAKERIIFDHLSPSSPEEKGDYRMYGPDSTYDALEFKKGKWYLKKNIDLRMDKKEGKLGKPKKIKKIKPKR